MIALDPSRALLALDELAKWQERRRRVSKRLSDVRARKGVLRRELEAVQAKIANLGALLVSLSGIPSAPRDVPTPPGLIR